MSSCDISIGFAGLVLNLPDYHDSNYKRAIQRNYKTRSRCCDRATTAPHVAKLYKTSSAISFNDEKNSLRAGLPRGGPPGPQELDALRRAQGERDPAQQTDFPETAQPGAKVGGIDRPLFRALG